MKSLKQEFSCIYNQSSLWMKAIRRALFTRRWQRSVRKNISLPTDTLAFSFYSKKWHFLIHPLLDSELTSQSVTQFIAESEKDTFLPLFLTKMLAWYCCLWLQREVGAGNGVWIKGVCSDCITTNDIWLKYHMNVLCWLLHSKTFLGKVSFNFVNVSLFICFIISLYLEDFAQQWGPWIYRYLIYGTILNFEELRFVVDFNCLFIQTKRKTICEIFWYFFETI